MFKNRDSIIKKLSEVPLLSSCTKEQLVNLAQHLDRVNFVSGEALMKQGDEGDEFFIIVQGKCNVLVGTVHVTKVAILTAGDYCGEQALLQNSVRNASVIAVSEKVVTLRANRKTFLNIIGNDLGLQFAARKAVCVDDTDVYEPEKDADITKSESEKKWLWYVVSANPLFINLTPSQKSPVIDAMFRKYVKKDSFIIREGEMGDYFYAIRRGKFKVTSKNGAQIAIVGPGSCVGETALIYNAPRSAGIQCIEDGMCWCIHRAAMKQILRDSVNQQTGSQLSFLKQVPIFTALLPRELIKVAEALKPVVFHKGEVIIKQGDIGDMFYVIRRGEATVDKISKNRHCRVEKYVGTLKQGSYFGERALITNERRAASIIAKTERLECLTLDRQQFDQLLGPLSELLSRSMYVYKQNLLKVTLERRKQADMAAIERQFTTFGKLEDFHTLGVMACGSIAVVKLVRNPLDNRVWALKKVRKDTVVENKRIPNIQNERHIMYKLHSPFTVSLGRTYQDEQNVYFLMEPCLGGDMLTLLRKYKTLTEQQAKFYAVCAIEGLTYLHNLRTIYRNLKPENMVINSRGYLKLADFGFSKKIDTKTFTFCGTPEYIPPETLVGQGQDFAADFWTLGCFIYEMLAGSPPFRNENTQQLFRSIIMSKPKFPPNFTKEAKDLIKKLLCKDPSSRLGNTVGGSEAILKHKWFRGFAVGQVQNQCMDAPIKPTIDTDADLSNFPNQKINSYHSREYKEVDTSWAEKF